MRLTFLVIRSLVYASAFLWLWTWVARLLRRFDSFFGGPLPVWTETLGYGGLVLGAGLVVWCIGAFTVQGRGTPAIFDSPRRLVGVGPYRYIRNPMYIGGALLLMGFGCLLRSPSILVFVSIWWLLFHLFVVLYEEHTLRAKFGPDYEEYCRRTPRWIPRFGRAASVEI